MSVSTLASMVVVSDAYGRFLNSIFLNKASFTRALEESTQRIQDAITAQNQAHFEAARRALRDGDFDDAIRSLRQGLPLDPFNSQAQGIYATLLAIRGNHKAALEEFTDMHDKFGPACPGIPEILRDVFNANSNIAIESNKPITIKIPSLNSDSIAVTKKGIVGLLYNSDRSYDWHLFPWDGRASYDVGYQHFVRVSDRYMWDNSFVAEIGDYNDIKKMNLLGYDGTSAQRIGRIFGDTSLNSPFVQKGSGKCRGVEIVITPGPVVSQFDRLKDRWWGYESINRMQQTWQVTATPPVVAPQKALAARPLELPPSLLQRMLELTQRTRLA